jgi:hypothetical protein
MPAVRRAREHGPGGQAGAGAPDAAPGPAAADPAGTSGRAGGLGRRLRAMPPTGLVILAATVLALALRLFLVTDRKSVV